VKNSVSVFRKPRGTVPSTNGRDESPSLKKTVERYGFIFGWSCMSRRQALVSKQQTANSKQQETERFTRLGIAKRSQPFLAVCC
jgi:hypothetical protein